MNRLAAWILAMIVSAPLAAAEPLLMDDFTSAEHPLRTAPATRGQWMIGGGVAVCTQNDELYKKNKDHGPILLYALPFSTGTIRFSHKAQGVKTLVFTLNSEKGHVFRFVQTATGLSARAWPKPGHDGKPVVLGAPGLKTPTIAEGRWVQTRVVVEKGRATISLGDDFKQVYEHESIGQSASQMTLGFSFGTLSIRDVKATQAP